MQKDHKKVSTSLADKYFIESSWALISLLVVVKYGEQIIPFSLLYYDQPRKTIPWTFDTLDPSFFICIYQVHLSLLYVLFLDSM